MPPGLRPFRAELVHWTNSETPFTPPRGPVDGHEQMTARVRRENCPPDSFLIRLTISFRACARTCGAWREMRQILHVDVDVAGLVLRDD